MVIKDIGFIASVFVVFVIFTIAQGYFSEHAEFKLNIGSIIAAAVFTLIIYAVHYLMFGSSSNFLFEVSPNKPRCSIGYTGLPHLNFKYTPDNERMNMAYCDSTNAYNQAKLLRTPKDGQDENMTDRWLW